MKFELGNIKVKDEQDMINLRIKIVRIFDLLFDDNIFAIKASTLLSTMVKRLLVVYAPLNVYTHVGTDKGGTICMRITGSKRLDMPFLLKKYHSAIQVKQADGSVHVEIRRAINLANLEQAYEVYSKPSLDDLIQEMKVKNLHLEESIENLKKARELNLRMESELEVGQNIQMNMLPANFPSNDYIELHASLIPAREVGGDFYDFYFIDENHFCFVVGDVSGKGVPAALMMAVTKTLLKSQATSDMSTASILTHVNNEIARDNEASMFITIFMAILDTITGELVYSNAGHNPSFVLHSATGKVTKLTELHGPVVGALPELTYKEARVQLLNHDCIFAYTDGVTEAQDFNNELFSDPRLEKFLADRISQKPEDLVIGIIDEVKLFEKGKEQADDITVLAIRYNDNPLTVTVKRERIEIANKLEEIVRVQRVFDAFAEENNIPVDIAMRLNIAFDEILNNIISYAFTDEKEHVIEIQMELRDLKLVITISDDGIPFNSFGKTAPDTTQSIEERQIGGLGIHLVKKMVDRYSYDRITNKNIMTLVKKV